MRRVQKSPHIHMLWYQARFPLSLLVLTMSSLQYFMEPCRTSDPYFCFYITVKTQNSFINRLQQQYQKATTGEQWPQRSFQTKIPWFCTSVISTKSMYSNFIFILYQASFFSLQLACIPAPIFLKYYFLFILIQIWKADD